VSFESDIKKIRKRYMRDLTDATEATLFYLTEQVIKGTPVDTGRAKANWQATINRPANGTVTSNDTSGRDSSGKTGKDAQVVITNAVGKVYHLTNNVPYIGILEFVPNYSKQMPHGWVRKAVKKFKKVYRQNLKAVGL